VLRARGGAGAVLGGLGVDGGEGLCVMYDWWKRR